MSMSYEILLRSSHVYLPNELVEDYFGTIHYAYVIYLPETRKMLITPVNSRWFANLYSPTQFLLKSRNLKGDRTLAIREILIDNDLNMEDRNLIFELEKDLNLISVFI